MSLAQIKQDYVTPNPNDMQALIKAYLQDLIDNKLENLPTGSDEVSVLIQTLAGKMQTRVGTEMSRCVNLSIEVNETAIFSAKMLNDIRNVDHQTQGIAVAAEEMVATVKEIETYGTNIATQAVEAQSATKSGAEAVRNATTNMGEITKAVNMGVEQVNVLSEFTDKISGIAVDIKKIAEHTNMLAINAMIEAARAGETGKGFAVIAGEVKSLAGKTAISTEEIGGIIIDLQDKMKTVIECMDNSTIAVETGQTAITEVDTRMAEIDRTITVVTENTSQISNALREQNQASNEVAQGIAVIAASSSGSLEGIESIVNSMDKVEALITEQITALAEFEVPAKVIKLAQSDHVIWKKKLANMVTGRAGLKADELADHHSCRLGKWYDNVTDPKYLNNPAFIELKGPHKLVHQHGIDAVKLYNAQNTKQALAEISIVEDASKDVLRLLAILEKQG
ncbi:MAG: CZB domain-containing protein [Robiginitomaculum sp.]|nr:CZB domain-containing protein [Robiginitomaculum sp.]